MAARGSDVEIVRCEAFHTVPAPEAQVLIVGLTPGRHQYELALEVMAEGGGRSELERKVAFAGSMRTNLVAMLDDLGLGAILGVATFADAFGCPMLETTSAVRDPVFVKGRNWTGSSPGILRNERTREYVETHLRADLLAVPLALVIPLGKAVSTAIRHLGDDVQPDRVLFGFPHPSGANGHRARQYRQVRDQLAEVVKAWAAAHP